ncbi:MAG: hypothetical protein ACKO6A_07020, partial [Bacteroidota bacterium]
MYNKFLTVTLLLLLFSGCTEDSVENAEKKITGNVSTTDVNNKNLDGKTPIKDSDESELTVEERVEQIRSWYGEIQKIGMQNCKTKSKTLVFGEAPVAHENPAVARRWAAPAWVASLSSCLEKAWFISLPMQAWG